MRKTWIIMTLLLAMACNMHADNKLTVKPFEIEIGKTAELIISMENEIDVQAYDFRLYLPEGTSLVYDEDEEDYVYELSSRHTKSHAVTIMPNTTENFILIGVASSSMKKVKENSGEIIRFTIKCDENATIGKTEGSLQKIWLATDGTSGAEAADVKFEVDIVSLTAIEGIYNNNASQSGTVYNLQGLKAGDSASKGVYIQNGKKFVK